MFCFFFFYYYCFYKTLKTENIVGNNTDVSFDCLIVNRLLCYLLYPCVSRFCCSLRARLWQVLQAKGLIGNPFIISFTWTICMRRHHQLERHTERDRITVTNISGLKKLLNQYWAMGMRKLGGYRKRMGRAAEMNGKKWSDKMSRIFTWLSKLQTACLRSKAICCDKEIIDNTINRHHKQWAMLKNTNEQGR